jgi:hypothetical protein
MRRWQTLLLLCVLTMTLPAAARAIVTEVSLAEFGQPRVLDMEAAADGPIQGDDPLFTDFGVVSISATSDDPATDSYTGGTPSFRALFNTISGGLIMVSLPVPPWFDNNPTFTLQLDQEQWLFGVAPVDTLGDLRIRFTRGALVVGELTFYSDRESTYYFHSTESFWTSRISRTAGGSTT